MEQVFTAQKVISEQTEAEQIEAARKDPGKFEILYKIHHPSIFRFILTRVNLPDTAADLTSQVFVKALSALPDYEYRGIPFSSWLFRIAYNQCMIYFRERKNSHYVVIDNPTIEKLMDGYRQLSDEPLPDLSGLRYALQHLKDEEVEIIEMRFFEERSFRTIGEILGITENNAKVRTYRILQKLRKHLVK